MRAGEVYFKMDPWKKFEEFCVYCASACCGQFFKSGSVVSQSDAVKLDFSKVSEVYKRFYDVFEKIYQFYFSFFNARGEGSRGFIVYLEN